MRDPRDICEILDAITDIFIENVKRRGGILADDGQLYAVVEDEKGKEIIEFFAF